MIASINSKRYGELLVETLPAVITDDAELERLTEVANKFVTKGIKQNGLSLEEEKLLKLLTQLIEDYEREHYSLEN